MVHFGSLGNVLNRLREWAFVRIMKNARTFSYASLLALGNVTDVLTSCTLHLADFYSKRFAIVINARIGLVSFLILIFHSFDVHSLLGLVYNTTQIDARI